MTLDRSYHSKPIKKVMNLINLILRGRMNYFRSRTARNCFSHIQDWVEKKKMRRHLVQLRRRREFGPEAWIADPE